jgi:hypothetical protein
MSNLKDIFGQSFNSADVEPQQSFDVLPAGNYTLEVVNAEVRDTKAGDGKYLWIEHDVIDPVEFAKRKVWGNVTLRNPNAQAEQIGAAQLSGLCRAAGIGELEDTDQLIGKVVRAKVAIKPAKDGYEASNTIKAYESANASAPKAAPAAAKPAAKPAAPWAKKAA